MGIDAQLISTSQEPLPRVPCRGSWHNISGFAHCSRFVHVVERQDRREPEK